MTLQSEQAISATYRLSGRLSVTFTVGAGGLVCEWDPDTPTRMSGGEARRYRRARNEMLQRLADLIGGRVLLIDHERVQAIDPAGDAHDA